MKEGLPEPLRPRIDQIQRAAMLLGDAARKLCFDLHATGYAWPNATKQVMEDLETACYRLGSLLRPEHIHPLNATHSAGRDNPSEQADRPVEVPGREPVSTPP